MFDWRNGQMEKFLVGEMVIRETVRLGKCSIGKLSGLGNAWWRNCPVKRTASQRNVWSWNCQSRNYLGITNNTQPIVILLISYKKLGVLVVQNYILPF